MDSQWKLDIERRVSKVETELEENTELTRKVKADTGELVDAFQAAKGAWTVLEFIGKVAKPVLWLGAAAAITHQFGAKVLSLFGIWKG